LKIIEIIILDSYNETLTLINILKKKKAFENYRLCLHSHKKKLSWSAEMSIFFTSTLLPVETAYFDLHRSRTELRISVGTRLMLMIIRW
jgi:hypothetical protein